MDLVGKTREPDIAGRLPLLDNCCTGLDEGIGDGTEEREEKGDKKGRPVRAPESLPCS